MTFNIFDERDPITVFVSGHGEIGNEHVCIKLWEVIDQCCRVFKFTDYIHPLDLFK